LSCNAICPALVACICFIFVGEEEKRRAHEALEKQEAELAQYAQQVAADQQQAAALQAKIRAMEEKVTCILLLRACSHLQSRSRFVSSLELVMYSPMNTGTAICLQQ